MINTSALLILLSILNLLLELDCFLCPDEPKSDLLGVVTGIPAKPPKDSEDAAFRFYVA